MEIRDFTEQDYPIVKPWWQGHGKPFMGLEYLPMGVIVPNHACGFLYMFKDMNVAWPGMLLTNPENSIHESSDSLRMVLAALMQKARENGVYAMQAFPRGHGLQEMHAELGWTGSDESVREFTVKL